MIPPAPFSAWDSPIPFAYSFEKDGKLVFMRYTGFKTNAEIMRPAANEIAGRMSNAPVIEQQRRQATQPFKANEVWADQNIRTVFGVSETTPVAPNPRGISGCSWSIYKKGSSNPKTVAFEIYKRRTDQKEEHECEGYKAFSSKGENH